MALRIAAVLVLTLSWFPALAVDPPANHPETASLVPPHVVGHRVPLAGIANFGEVTPFIYRGAQPSRQGLARLADMNVAIVVDLRSVPSESESSAVRKFGMQYVSIPSHCPFPRDESFVRLLKLIRDNRQKKIFVHCRLGEDRTGMAVAAYRMSEENWTADEAMKEMQAFGFKTFHRAICPGLVDYERSFPERLKHSATFRGLRPDMAASDPH